jgi:hypothetical protein
MNNFFSLFFFKSELKFIVSAGNSGGEISTTYRKEQLTAIRHRKGFT